MDVKEYEKVSDVEFNDMLIDLADSSDENWAYAKILEEAIEASEVLIKLLTKTKENRPSTLQLVEELGDLQARIAIFATKSKLHDDIFDRAQNKIQFLHEALKAGKLGANIIISRP